MELFHSATSQKACKISIGTESNISQDSPKNDWRFSTEPEIDGLDGLIQNLKSKIETHMHVPDLPPSVSSLKHLVNLVCDEFDNFHSKQINLSNSNGSTIDEISVNLMKASQKDAITRVFDMPEQGVFLSKDDCKNLSALIIGAFRDSASHGLKKRISELQEKVINLATVNIELKKELVILAGMNEDSRNQLTEKDYEIDHLIEKVEELEAKLQD